MKGCRALEADEVALVAANLTTARDRALFIVGMKTGFRVSELIQIRVADVWQHGAAVDMLVLRVKHGYQRPVPLHREAKAAVQELMEELIAQGRGHESAALFQSRKGYCQPIHKRQAQLILADAFKRSGLSGPVGSQTMRKTFARTIYTRLRQDIVSTAEALGHRCVQNTAYYVEGVPDYTAMRKAILAD
jgi:site-specific recombinase XerD